jgi:RNA-binding protein
MNELPVLTGAQRTHLRGLGQLLSDSLRIGRAGPTPALFIELNRQLDTRELVKARFESTDREERAAMCERMAAETPCLCLGTVGRTALFYRPKPSGSQLLAALPD